MSQTLSWSTSDTTNIHAGIFNAITADRYPKCAGTAGSLIGLDIDSSEATGFDFAAPPRWVTSGGCILMKNLNFTWNVMQPAVKCISNKMFRTWSDPGPMLVAKPRQRQHAVSACGTDAAVARSSFPAGIGHYLSAVSYCAAPVMTGPLQRARARSEWVASWMFLSVGGGVTWGRRRLPGVRPPAPSQYQLFQLWPDSSCLNILDVAFSSADSSKSICLLGSWEWCDAASVGSGVVTPHLLTETNGQRVKKGKRQKRQRINTGCK